jgi:hypothetical protein
VSGTVFFLEARKGSGYLFLLLNLLLKSLQNPLFQNGGFPDTFGAGDFLELLRFSGASSALSKSDPVVFS